MGFFWKLLTAPNEEASRTVVAKAIFDHLTGKKTEEPKKHWYEQRPEEPRGNSSWSFGKPSEKKTWFK